jgi:hypothetical protein
VAGPLGFAAVCTFGSELLKLMRHSYRPVPLPAIAVLASARAAIIASPIPVAFLMTASSPDDEGSFAKGRPVKRRPRPLSPAEDRIRAATTASGPDLREVD